MPQEECVCVENAEAEKEEMIVEAVEEIVEKEQKRRRDKIDIETETLANRNKLIIELTWPALAENILASLVSMADTIMVSILGSHAISAVGLVTQPRLIMLSAFIAMGTGVTAMVARAKGAGNKKEADTVLRQSIVVSVALLLVLCIIMMIFCRQLISWIAGANISTATIEAAVGYFEVQIIGFPFLGLTSIMNAALRGVGNTRAAFYSNTTANIVNVIFNYLLIGGNLGFPALGVVGASIATVIGQGVAFFFCLYLLLSKRQYIHLSVKDSYIPDLSIIRRITRIGIPALIEQVVLRVGILAFTLIVTSLGDIAYTSHTIALNIQSLSFTTGMAFGTAATTLTGQCLGRKRPDLAKEYVKLTQRMSYGVSILIAVLLFVGGGFISRWYTNDASVITLVSQVLMIVAIANPLSNARFVYNAALRGAGDARYTAMTTFVGVILVRPVLAALLVYVFQLHLIGVWIAFSVDPIVIFILAKIRWASGRWATIKV